MYQKEAAAEREGENGGGVLGAGVPDKGRTGELFSRRAGKYGISADHVTGADLAYIEEYVEGKNLDLALDVSTGAGHTAGLLGTYCSRVLALDISQGMLLESRRLYGGGNISFVRGDSESLPFGGGIFSLVTCRIAPHHFVCIPDFMRETARVLREGGALVLVDSTVPEDLHLAEFMNRVETIRDETHVRTHTIPEWERFFEGSPFRVIDRRVFRKTHDFHAWLSRAHPSADREAELTEMIMNAGTRVQRYYQIEIEGGKIVSYTDDKALFLALKEGATDGQ